MVVVFIERERERERGIEGTVWSKSKRLLPSKGERGGFFIYSQSFQAS